MLSKQQPFKTYVPSFTSPASCATSFLLLCLLRLLSCMEYTDRQTDRQTDIQIDRKKCSDKACKAKSQLVHRHKNQREIVHHSQEAAPNVSYCQGSLQIASSLLPAHVQSSTRKNAHQMHPTIHPIQNRQACMHRKGRRRR